MKSMPIIVVCSCALASAAPAQVISDSPHALGGNRLYVGNLSYHSPLVDVFFDMQMTMGGPALLPLTMPGQTRAPSMDGVVILYSSLPGGAPTPHPAVMSFLESFAGAIGEGASDVACNTEMLALDLMGVDPVHGPFRVRESPTLPSLGHYSVLYHLSDGLYHIDSFFDVFTELSLDGGQSWTPSNGPSHITIMPAPGAAALLGTGLLLVCRRRTR